MKVNNPNLSSLASTGTSGPQGPPRTGAGGAGATSSPAASPDDVHLSELVRSLRALAADSPEHQARVDQIAKSYTTRSYSVDPAATASKIVDDALKA